jgi:hypothetical protein
MQLVMYIINNAIKEFNTILEKLFSIDTQKTKTKTKTKTKNNNLSI